MTITRTTGRIATATTSRGDITATIGAIRATGGTIVGAIAGGLLGRSVDRRGDRTLGTVLGGAVGALAGNAIDKSDNPRYCR